MLHRNPNQETNSSLQSMESNTQLKNTKASASNRAVTEVIWLDTMMKEIQPQNTNLKQASIVPIWTVGGKYVYQRTQISWKPLKYKEHTAYYMYQNWGTKSVTRQINFAKGTSIPVMTTTIGVVIGLVSYFAAPALAAALTIDIISGVGLEVSANRLTNAFSPTLGVNATRYDSKFVDSLGNGNNQTFAGEKITVTDVESKRFNKSYYEGCTPQISRDFSYTAFLNTFKGGYIKYPGLKSYTEY